MDDNRSLKILSIGLILLRGAMPATIVSFQDKTLAILTEYTPSSRRCEQALPGICEMRCRSKDNYVLEFMRPPK